MEIYTTVIRDVRLQKKKQQKKNENKGRREKKRVRMWEKRKKKIGSYSSLGLNEKQRKIHVQ